MVVVEAVGEALSSCTLDKLTTRIVCRVTLKRIDTTRPGGRKSLPGGHAHSSSSSSSCPLVLSVAAVSSITVPVPDVRAASGSMTIDRFRFPVTGNRVHYDSSYDYGTNAIVPRIRDIQNLPVRRAHPARFVK